MRDESAQHVAAREANDTAPGGISIPRDQAHHARAGDPASRQAGMGSALRRRGGVGRVAEPEDRIKHERQQDQADREADPLAETLGQGDGEQD